MMNGKENKHAKYNFGLLETPDSLTSGTSSMKSNGRCSTNPKRIFPKFSSESFGLRTSTSSRSVDGSSSASSKKHGTPFKASSNFSCGKSPAFKTPQTPRASRTPKAHCTYSSMTPGAENSTSVLVAIVEGRGLARGEIGMASIDLKSPVLVMSQFSDSQTYVKTITKLQILKPLEIVLANTACENGNVPKLFQIISDQFQNATISTVQRRYFNETKGLQYIQQLCLADYKTVEMEVANKYYCLATAAALMKYVEFIQNIMFTPNSLKIIFKGSENTTMIDVMTATSLELLENKRDPRSSHTLFGILNYTHTAGGARLLRSNILQPTSDLETILMRQDVLRELTGKEEVFYNLQSVMSKFLDVDHIISMCVQIPKQESVKTAESKINTVICLKHVLGLVPVLYEFLKDCENQLLKAYCKTLEDPRFELIVSKINSVIHEDTKYQKGTLPMRTQKCFAVKVC